jgi:pimeloyl-ACP methyl ester carboxylesterase
VVLRGGGRIGYHEAAMEPQFRFCTSADGTRIAYAVYGSGPPLLYANTYVLSMDAQFTLPAARAYFDALAARTTLVIFDRRGTGASARDVDDLSPEAEAGDIAAVAAAAALRDFTLFADIATAACASYAIQHQEPVLRLILWSPFVGGGGAWDREQARAFREDWTYARRVWAGLVYPEGPVSLQRAFSKAIKDTLSAEMAARRFELGSEVEVDLGALLPAVTAPTLVLQRETKGRRIAIQAAGLLRTVSCDSSAAMRRRPFPTTNR